MLASDLFVIGIPVIEKIVRTVAVYFGIEVLLRLGGKRDLAQLNSFDLVVILLLSNVVQNALIGDDNSLLGGLLGAAVLVAVNAIVVRTVARNERLSRLFEGSETILIRDGQFDEQILRREGLRRGDLLAAVRRQGADAVREVEEAKLAPGGAVIVRLRPGNRNATREDLAVLQHQLAHVSAQVEELLARLP